MNKNINEKEFQKKFESILKERKKELKERKKEKITNTNLKESFIQEIKLAIQLLKEKRNNNNEQ